MTGNEIKTFDTFLKVLSRLSIWGFDPGPGWTLAACFKHASRAGLARDKLRTAEYKIGIYPLAGNTHPKGWLIPHKTSGWKRLTAHRRMSLSPISLLVG